MATLVYKIPLPRSNARRNFPRRRGASGFITPVNDAPALPAPSVFDSLVRGLQGLRAFIAPAQSILPGPSPFRRGAGAFIAPEGYLTSAAAYPPCARGMGCPCVRGVGRMFPRRGMGQDDDGGIDVLPLPTVATDLEAPNPLTSVIESAAGTVPTTIDTGSLVAPALAAPAPFVESAPSLAAANQALTNAQASGLNLNPAQLAQLSKAFASASPAQLQRLTGQLNAYAAAPSAGGLSCATAATAAVNNNVARTLVSAFIDILRTSCSGLVASLLRARDA